MPGINFGDTNLTPERKKFHPAPDHPLYKKRVEILRQDGFSKEEAYELAHNTISSKSMLRGRARRRLWRNKLLKANPNLRQSEYAEMIDDLYDTYDWASVWAMFYPEGVGDARMREIDKQVAAERKLQKEMEGRH